MSLVSENTGIAPRLVTTAVRYWAAYPGEVDAEIAAADAARWPARSGARLCAVKARVASGLHRRARSG